LFWFHVVLLVLLLLLLVMLCFALELTGRALIMLRCTSFKFWLHLIIVGCCLEVACLVTTDDVGSALLCFALFFFVSCLPACLPAATIPVDNLLTAASFPLLYLSLRTSLLPSTNLILP
jgi:hypothetical protein